MEKNISLNRSLAHVKRFSPLLFGLGYAMLVLSEKYSFPAVVAHAQVSFAQREQLLNNVVFPYNYLQTDKKNPSSSFHAAVIPSKAFLNFSYML